MCESLLSEANIEMNQLEAVAFGRGPGSFTGVRIAAGIAQGIAFALDVPVISISTLATIAQEVITEARKAKVLAAIDARMGEIYWGYYRADKQHHAHLTGEEHVGRPDQVAIPGEPEWYGAGTGWAAYGDILVERLGQLCAGYGSGQLPNAKYLVSLAERAYGEGLAVPAEQAQPVYLRNEVAKKSHNR
jgi:tRNA threonylcarbamoyladenosine biosynthesis protein TsaB